MDSKKENFYNENDINFYQKPYSENNPYNMVKMAAVEPICFYPNREYVNEFNNRKLNMKKLIDYIYIKKGIHNKSTSKQNDSSDHNIENDNTEDEITTEEEKIINNIYQPYYLPEFYNSTFVNQIPLINILPAECLHETKKQYQNYEKLHYEEPEWTQAEKDLFNLLYKTIGKDFHKMAKEFENRATTLVIPSSILKKNKVNITGETADNMTALITPLDINDEIETNDKISNKRKRHNNDTGKKKNKKNKIEESEKRDEDNKSFECQVLQAFNNDAIHLLVQNLKDANLMQRDDMIFPRKTSEIIHFYYKNKFNMPNWKKHREDKVILKKNKIKK